MLPAIRMRRQITLLSVWTMACQGVLDTREPCSFSDSDRGVWTVLVCWNAGMAPHGVAVVETTSRGIDCAVSERITTDLPRRRCRSAVPPS